MKQCLLDFSLTELGEILSKYDCPKYRAKQAFAWLYDGVDFDGMTNLPRALLDRLSKDFDAQSAAIVEERLGANDVAKYLYRFSDGTLVEGVFLPNDYGNTLCVSTQAGCRMGCAFCASTIGGLDRNLTAGEILGQVIVANRKNGGTASRRQIANLVLMGSGEPLDNYENVARFLRLATSPDGINISARNISLSTCGLVDGIKRLADDDFGVTLSISLHATLDEERQKVMPIAKKYDITSIMDAARYYFDKTGRRVVFEYAMIKGVNINFFDAKRLHQLTKGFPCHINLIPLNKTERGVDGCTPQQAQTFLDRLTALGVSATIRRSLGSDIEGACGQLRRKFGGTKED